MNVGFFVSLFFLFFLSFFKCKPLQNWNQMKLITNGEIDLTQHNFESTPLLKLYGKFKFYHNKFANEINATTSELIEVPKSWTSLGYESFGYATYELKIKIPQEGKFALYIPDAATSFRVIWNGKILASSGKVAKEPQDYIPSYRTEIIPLNENNLDNLLQIEVANFDHHKGGLWEAIYIARRETLERKILLRNHLYSFSIGASFILGFYHIGLFRFRKKELLELLFALLCFSLALQNLFSNSNLVYILFPEIHWRFYVKINYFFSYLPGILFILFYERLFPETFSKIIFKILILIFVSLCLVTIFLPIYYFTQTLIYAFITYIFSFLYIFFKFLTSIRNKNFQYYLILLALGILILTIILDALSLTQIFPFSSTSIWGILIFIYSHGYILSIRFSKALLTVENLAQRLKRSNKKLKDLKSELETIIEKRTQELIRERTRAELIGRMTIEIVHDLKNPIYAIIGFSGLANSDNIGRQARQEYLELIQAESIKLADLSQGILDYVKGGAKIQKEKVNLKEYFENINKLLYNEFKLAKIQYKFELETEENGYFDPELLRRVIFNIASNAIHALLKSSKDEKVFSIKVSSNQGYLEIEFKDNGTGIPKEIQNRVFEPFVTHGKKSGTGLGMTLAKEIVESHSGEISFITQEGIGTTFFVRLPLE